MGPGTRKPAERTNSGNLSDIFKFMLDQGAGTARGIYRGTVGLPGDLESLVRLGIGGEQYLPTSEDVGKSGKWYSAPPLKPLLKGDNPYDTLGQFYNLPIYGGAAKLGTKGLKQFASKAVNGPFDESKRAFGKKAAAIGGAAALAPLMKLSEHLAPAAKQIDEVAPIAKQADEVIKPTAKTHRFNSLKEYNDYLNKEALHEVSRNPHLDYNSDGSFLNEWKSFIAKQEEELYNSTKQSVNEYLKLSENPEFGGDPTLVRGINDHDEMANFYNAFSPQAKAEMKAFKNSIIDPADEAFRADVPHWSELLDDYIKWEHDIPYPAKGSIDSMLGGSAAALGIRGLENSAGLKLVPSKSSTVKDPIQELLNSMLAEAKRDELYNYNKSGFKGTLEEWRKANTPEPQFAKTPVTNKEKQEAMWNSVQEAKRIMESENRGAPPHLRFFGERAKNDYERRLKEYLDLYGNVTPIK